MNSRRFFIKLAPALAAPALAGVALSEEREERNQILGAWINVVTAPNPPITFREFLGFAEGGAVQETNTFVHTASNVNFSPFGLPSAVNGSDGIGTWRRLKPGVFAVHFRKLLFDAAGTNFGDLVVTGTLTLNDGVLKGEWHVKVADTNNVILGDFGIVTSEGTRLS